MMPSVLSVGVLDRGGLRNHDQDRVPGLEEEVEHVEGAAGRQVEHHVVHVQGAELAQQLLLLGVAGVRHPDQRPRAADQPQVRLRRLGQDVFQVGDLAVEEVREGATGPVDAEQHALASHQGIAIPASRKSLSG